MCIFTGAKTIAKVPSTRSTILGKTKKKLNFTFFFITYTIFTLSRYSMESHAVHWNRKYVTVEECFRHKDGFCILAYLFLVRNFNVEIIFLSNFSFCIFPLGVQILPNCKKRSNQIVVIALIRNWKG